MVSDTTKHYPVLLNEIISIISPQHGGSFIDCTYGQGGYTKAILKYKNTQVIALDRDIETKKKAQKLIDKFHNRFIFKNKKFSQLDNLKLKNENIRAIIFDLGYSYLQIKDSSKGLSFNSNGKLNMQMGINDFSAEEAVNNLNAEDINEKLSSLAAEKILDNIDDIYEDKANFIEQDHSSATYALKIQKLEGQINWKEDAKIIIGKINGLYPVPGAFFMFNGERYKILKAEIGQAQGKPGEVLSDYLEISCGDKKSIKIKEIQRQGKKPQSIGEFVLGTQIKKGSFL